MGSALKGFLQLLLAYSPWDEIKVKFCISKHSKIKLLSRSRILRMRG